MAAHRRCWVGRSRIATDGRNPRWWTGCATTTTTNPRMTATRSMAANTRPRMTSRKRPRQAPTTPARHSKVAAPAERKRDARSYAGAILSDARQTPWSAVPMRRVGSPPDGKQWRGGRKGRQVTRVIDPFTRGQRTTMPPFPSARTVEWFQRHCKWRKRRIPLFDRDIHILSQSDRPRRDPTSQPGAITPKRGVRPPHARPESGTDAEPSRPIARRETIPATRRSARPPDRPTHHPAPDTPMTAYARSAHARRHRANADERRSRGKQTPWPG